MLYSEQAHEISVKDDWELSLNVREVRKFMVIIDGWGYLTDKWMISMCLIFDDYKLIFICLIE